jgi:hypothetical protein
MKEAIHDLECALEKLGYVDAGIVYTVCEKPFCDAKELIQAAVTHLENVVATAELQSPRWETPEQYWERTGKPWPDDWAVYYQGRILLCSIVDAKIVNEYWSPFSWHVATWKSSRKVINSGMEARKYHDFGLVICATEAGPPPEGWEPEEEKGK